MQIDIDFEVFKALTSLRKRESHTYNDVLRELLKLKPSGDESPASVALSKGLLLRGGLFLPDGTRLRVTYRGIEYLAEIKNGRWVDQAGTEHASPSAAAQHITKTNVNGWRFWEAKRPSDVDWRKLDVLSSVR
ncbi:MAG TPA: hypothetical protein VF688_03950 [Allosphingosinicella sp.]|jgi:hypothetical protein